LGRDGEVGGEGCGGGRLLLALQRLQLRLPLLQVVLRHGGAVHLLLEPRVLGPLLADHPVEFRHLREHLLVVVAHRREARVQVVIPLLEDGQLRGPVLKTAPQFHQLRALACTGRRKRRRRAMVLPLLQRHDLPLLLLQHLHQGGRPVICSSRRATVADAASRSRLEDRREGRAATSSSHHGGGTCWPRGHGRAHEPLRRPPPTRWLRPREGHLLVVGHLLRQLLLLGITLGELELELGDAVRLRELLDRASLVGRRRVVLRRLVLQPLSDAHHLHTKLPHLVLLLVIVTLQRPVLLAQREQLFLDLTRVAVQRRRRAAGRRIGAAIIPRPARRGHGLCR
jgi:hypothetical protein